MSEHYVGLRDIAVEVAEAAAGHIRRRRPEVFGGVGRTRHAATAATVQAKSSPVDPVTVVDLESEQLIRERLSQLRPGDTILGEEGGSDSVQDSDVRWVVDPIDGTVNFLYGIPAFAVSVAAQQGGRSVAGAVVDVAGGVTYCAALGHGARRLNADGRVAELRCSDAQSVSLSLVATGFAYNAARRTRQGELISALLGDVRDIRRIGSAALDLCMVAAGLVDAHYEHGLGPWDWAAGALIASEAGAVLVQTPGVSSPSAAGEVMVAAAPGIAEELTAVLKKIGALDAIPV